MKLSVYQTIYIGTLDIDDPVVFVALNDGDDEKVHAYINRNSSLLTQEEVIDQTFKLKEELDDCI